MAQNDLYAKEAYLGVPYSALLYCMLEPFGEILRNPDAQAIFHTSEIPGAGSRYQYFIICPGESNVQTNLTTRGEKENTGRHHISSTSPICPNPVPSSE